MGRPCSLRESGRLRRRWLWGEYSLCRLDLCFNFLLNAWNHLAHYGGVADEFAVDGDGAAHLDDASAPVEDGDFDAELISRRDRSTEAGRFRCW